MRVLRLVAALLLLSFLVVPGAHADDSAPEITSFRRADTAQLGPLQDVVLEVNAQDEGLAGLLWVEFIYRGPTGGIFQVFDYLHRESSGTFDIGEKLGAWQASGRYQLERVTVADAEDNRTEYTAATAPQFDFGSVDFEVDNPAHDITVPTVSSIELFSDQVVQGEPAVAIYRASDDLSQVLSVTVIGKTPTGSQFWLESAFGMGSVGPATWLVPLQAPPGFYEVTDVVVEDWARNVFYYSNEGERVYPERSTVPDHPSIDPSSLSFTVLGSSGDDIAPVLHSFNLITPKEVHPGEQIALDYEATDQGTGVSRFSASWVDGMGHILDLDKRCGDTTHGPATVDFEDFRSVDRDWTLVGLYLMDEIGNQALYYRDGTTRYNPDRGQPATHNFDLSAGDFHVEAGEPTKAALANTTEEWCPQESLVSLGLDDHDVIVGETVGTSGEVTVGGRPVLNPIVALYGKLAGQQELLAVLRGDAGGEYRTGFVADRKGTVSARFLGRLGPRGGNPSDSTQLPLIVRPKVSSWLEHGTIRVGERTSLKGVVEGASGMLKLQRYQDGRWATIGWQDLPLDGTFNFSVGGPRRGSYSYRVVMPLTTSLARGAGQVHVLKVRR